MSLLSKGNEEIKDYLKKLVLEEKIEVDKYSRVYDDIITARDILRKLHSHIEEVKRYSKNIEEVINMDL